MEPTDWWLWALIEAWQRHAQQPNLPKNATRRFDGKTPYGVHPTLAACMLAQESSLPPQTRTDGFAALAFHDLLEDTKAGLPEGTPQRVIELVQWMSFPGGSQEEFEKLPTMDPVVQLLKLYDKLSNLLDGVGPKGWMASRGEAYVANYVRHTAALAERVHDFMNVLAPDAPAGTVLNVVLFVRALAAQYLR